MYKLPSPTPSPMIFKKFNFCLVLDFFSKLDLISKLDFDKNCCFLIDLTFAAVAKTIETLRP